MKPWRSRRYQNGNNKKTKTNATCNYRETFLLCIVEKSHRQVGVPMETGGEGSSSVLLWCNKPEQGLPLFTAFLWPHKHSQHFLLTYAVLENIGKRKKNSSFHLCCICKIMNIKWQDKETNFEAKLPSIIIVFYYVFIMCFIYYYSAKLRLIYL